MQEIPFLNELAKISIIGVVVSVVLARFRLPTVAGLLLAGALIGPHGFSLVGESGTDTHAIETLAEIGVVLLLFTIGLEFSLERLRHIIGQVALGGALQVGITTAVTAGVAVLLGQTWERGLFYGFVFSMSSTAIVLKALTERGEVNAPHGRFVFGTLIFQDLCVVPMVLVIPLLAPQGADGGQSAGDVALALGKAVFVVLSTIAVARVVVPRVFRWVDASRSREVFLLAVVAFCIGTAWLTAQAGLSLALGAFLGGMVVADTEYGHRAMGDILPLRDAFVSIFFISLGMLFNVEVVVTEWRLVVLLVVGFLFAKGFLATVAALLLHFTARSAWLAGVCLAQFGEFGFVLGRLADKHGVMDAAALQPLFTAGVISMFLTTVLIRIAPYFTIVEEVIAPFARIFRPRVAGEHAKEQRHGTDSHASLENHVVIIGFGVGGRLVAKTLAACGIPYVALELNAETVRAARAANEPIFYADATSPESMQHARASVARLVVLLMNDPQAAQRIVKNVEHVAPGVPVLMRTRFLADTHRLLRLGAADVVAEEVEGAMEVLVRLMRFLDMPRNVIDERLNDARAATQSSERSLTVPRRTLGTHEGLAELKIESALITEASKANGRTAIELDVRKRTGALIIAVRRNGVLVEQLDPNAKFDPGDIVYLAGTLDAVRRALDLLTGGKAGAPQAVVVPAPEEPY